MEVFVLCPTWKTFVRACLGSLFWMTEKRRLSGLRKAEGCRHRRSRFCTVARMSISVSWNHNRSGQSCERTEPASSFIWKSYLRVVGSLEVGQQQADEHRALFLLAHESADPERKKKNKKEEEESCA